MTDSEEDDEDPVVHEVDVFLSRALYGKLYLFQYPVRPASMAFDEIPVVSAKIKTKQQKVEVELGLDTDNPNYCMPRGEQIAYTVDSNARDGSQRYYQSDIMDKQVLSSVRATQNTSKFLAGNFLQGALHMTPIEGVVQLRPNFDYLDKAEATLKLKEKAKTAEDAESQDEEEEEEAKPVMMKFTKGEKHIREGSLASLKLVQQKQAEEPWAETTYYPPQDPKSKSEKMLLCCHQEDFDSPEFTLTSREYLKILAPQPQGQVSNPSPMPEGILSLLKLKGMDIVDQVKAVLINAKSVQFSQVYSLLGTDIDEQEVLRALHHFALLVQGIWMVKSEILYPEDDKKGAGELEREKIWSARDYLMWLFNNKRVLQRKDISIIRIPSGELRDILEQMARYRVQGWEYALPTDVDFLARYQEIVKIQMDQWQAKYKSLCEYYGLSWEPFKEGYVLPGLDSSLHGRRPSRVRRTTTRTRTTSSGDSESPSRSPQKRGISRRARTKSGSLDFEVIDRTSYSVDSSKPRINLDKTSNEKLPIKLKPVTVKVEPMDIVADAADFIEISAGEDVGQICSVSNQSNGVSNDSTEAFIPPVALGKEPASARKPPSELFRQEVKNFVQETLRSTVLSFEEIKQVLELRQQEPGNILCSGVPDDLLEESILASGAECISVKWPENVNAHPHSLKMYGYRKVGGLGDKCRSVLLDAFGEAFGVRKKDVMLRFNQVFPNDEISSYSFQRMATEFCERYGSVWYLRGTYKIAFPENS